MRMLSLRRPALLFPAFAAASLATPALAQVLNPSFESPVLADGAFARNVPNWTVTGDAGVLNPSTAMFAGQADDGANVAFLGTIGGSGFLRQPLAINYAASTTYTLSVRSGRRSDFSASTVYRLSLLFGTTVVATQQFSNPPVGSFRTDTLTANVLPGDAAVGRPITVAVQIISGGQLCVDNVQFSSAALCADVSDQPDGGSICPGGNKTLSASFAGSAPFTYVWEAETAPGVWTTLTNGGAGPGGFSVVSITTSGGGLTSSMRLLSTTAGDAKKYRCTATAGCGSVTTETATLTMCPADFSCDGFIDVFDFFDFVNAFENGNPIADVDGDGFLDFLDYVEFIELFENGC